MKYLITGGAGFLGSNLSSKILSENEELFIFDNLYREGAYKNLKWLMEQGNVNFIHSDIRNKNDVETAIKSIEPDVIFHLAGQVAMTTSLKNPIMDFEVNTLGSLNLLEAVRNYSLHSIIVYSSTNKVYGDLEHLKYHENDTRYNVEDYPDGFDENLKLDFHSPYGCSKGAADQYMLDYARMYKLKTIVFRHSSMYGGRQFATYDQGWVTWFCQKAIEDKLFTISGDGKQVRDILHVDDLIECYFSAIQHIDKTAGNAFNIGGGMDNSSSLIELFNYLETTYDIKLKYKKIDWRKSDQKFFVADIAKAKDRFDWEPNISKMQGIKKTIMWIEDMKTQKQKR